MNRTRLALIASTTAVAAALLTGCAAGGDAATLQVAPNHAAGRAGGVLAQNIVVVVDPETGAAQLTGTVVNNGADRDQITAVTVAGQTIPLTFPLSIASRAALNLAADNGPKLVVSAKAKAGITAGMNSAVDLTFLTGGDLKLSAATLANTGDYSGYQPSLTAAGS